MYRQIYDAENGYLYEGARIQHYYYTFAHSRTFPFLPIPFLPSFDFYLSCILRFLSFLECCEALLVIDARLQQPLG